MAINIPQERQYNIMDIAQILSQTKMGLNQQALTREEIEAEREFKEKEFSLMKEQLDIQKLLAQSEAEKNAIANELFKKQAEFEMMSYDPQMRQEFISNLAKQIMPKGHWQSALTEEGRGLFGIDSPIRYKYTPREKRKALKKLTKMAEAYGINMGTTDIAQLLMAEPDK